MRLINHIKACISIKRLWDNINDFIDNADNNIDDSVNILTAELSRAAGFNSQWGRVVANRTTLLGSPQGTLRVTVRIPLWSLALWLVALIGLIWHRRCACGLHREPGNDVVTVVMRLLITVVFVVEITTTTTTMTSIMTIMPTTTGCCCWWWCCS